MKDDKVFVKHISVEMEFINESSENLKFENLMENETLKRAISRSLEIIGEASKNISNEFKTAHKEIPWREMAGLRDKLIHSYFGVDWTTVWDVIIKEIPELKQKIDNLSKHSNNK